MLNLEKENRAAWCLFGQFEISTSNCGLTLSCPSEAQIINRLNKSITLLCVKSSKVKHTQICCCLSVFVRLFILTSGVRGHDGIGYESIVSLRVLTEADKRACWCLVLTGVLCEPLCFKHILRLTAGHVTTAQRHHYHFTRSEMMINNLISSSDLRFCCLNGLMSLQWTLLKDIYWLMCWNGLWIIYWCFILKFKQSWTKRVF